MYQRPLRPDELMHHGILGMKWGIRRYQNEDGTLTLLGKRRVAQGKAKIDKKTGVYLSTTFKERRRAKKLKQQRIKNLQRARKIKDGKDISEGGFNRIIKNNTKKDPSSMSNTELDAGIARLKKEKEYKQLLSDTKSIEKGKSVVKEIIGDSAKEASKRILTAGAIAVGGAIVASMLGYEKDNSGQKPNKSKLAWDLLQPKKK